MHRVPGSIALCAALVLSGCMQGQKARQVAAAGEQARPAVEAVFPLPVVELAGSGQAMGTAHGQALREPIRALFDKYLRPQFSSPLQHMAALAMAQGFAQHMASEHVAEVRALAEAAGLTPGDTLLAQCFLDLMPLTACSTVALEAGASADGVARLGRNLDFEAMDIADKHSVVLIYRPAGKYQFAAVTWPGMIGVLSGMNEHGLTLANMEVDRPGRMPAAMPYMLLYRKVLEEAANVEQAVAILQSTPRQSANNLMLMDAAGRRAVVEITPERVVVRYGQPALSLVSTNHQQGDDQASLGHCWRYDALVKQSSQQQGQLSVDSLQRMLADVQQGARTMQSMIFEPSERVVYLAVGKYAASQQWHRLDLKRYFPRS